MYEYTFQPAAKENLMLPAEARSGSIKISLGAEAQAHIFEVLLPGQNANRTFNIEMAPDSRLTWTAIYITDTEITETHEINLEKGAELTHNIVYFGVGKSKIDSTVTAKHTGSHSVSHLNSRGVLQDFSYGASKGYIDMAQGIRDAKGILAQHILLLDDTVRTDALPALKIGTHDVIAQHKTSIEKIDRRKLFYATARGLAESEAIRVIVEGFLTAAIMSLQEEKLQEQLTGTIHQLIKT